MFIDERTITIAGGKGGNGVVHWHREKFLARGGPDGGNGGDGGDAYLVTVRDIRALERYREGEIVSAQDGMPGEAALRSGKNGDDSMIRVPVGSIVTNMNTKERFELMEEGQRVMVAAGGRGGLGNAHFKSSVNTTPKTATPGEPPQAYRFHIELNIIADVGIIGLPNAGKSTLLNTLTNAKARVASYPFTTLEPNLGIFHGYVLADIPGLIAHASEGKGLGHTFLRHIARTRALLHLVAADEPDVAEAYRTIRNELASYDPALLKKREVVVLSKADTIEQERIPDLLKQLPEGTVPLTVLDDESVTSLSGDISRMITKNTPQ